MYKITSDDNKFVFDKLRRYFYFEHIHILIVVKKKYQKDIEYFGTPVRNHDDRDDTILAQAEIAEQSSERMETGLTQNDVQRYSSSNISGITDVTHAIAHQDKQLSNLDLHYVMTNVRSLKAEKIKDGKLILKIKDYRDKKYESEYRAVIYSQPFYTSNHGYMVQASIYLNGDGMGNGSHLSLYVETIQGEFDALLKFPYQCWITLEVLNQTDPPKSVPKYLVADMTAGEKFGFSEFMPLDMLENPEQGYIVDDVLFVRVDVKPLS
ncbi:hypothetical protein KUTeg_013557 [Tegillarca granosa]|uniref:MATH domain-containing protein n=1 Tax=Tegillarca granosa TaxID=220873 RepID=A0ABQ9EZF7_TEGGR|nr:hypothetical protein KUTeg_013557 [Tegillarca granosa]